LPQVFHPLALLVDARFIALVGMEQTLHQRLGQIGGVLAQQLLGAALAVIEGHAEAEAEFGVVFKE
jgi:hypothetical protein